MAADNMDQAPAGGAVWAERYGLMHLGAIRAMTQSIMVLSTAIAPVLLGSLLDFGVGVTTLSISRAVVVLMISFLSSIPVLSQKKNIVEKYKQVRKNLNKKLKPVAAVSSGSGITLPQKPETKAIPPVPAVSGQSAAQAKPAVTAKPGAGAAKLPGGVSKRLRDIDRELNKAERYLSKDVKQAKHILDIEGHNPDLLVFFPGTSEPEKFGEAYERYEAFKAFYEEYKNTEFPAGRTDKLIDLAEKQTPARFSDFEEGFASRVEAVAGYAEKQIDGAMAYLERDNGWKSDKTVKPNLLDHKRMTAIQDAVENVKSGLAGDDPARQRVQEKFDALAAKDKANREIRKQRTVMEPDRYTGKDIKDLKSKAKALVKNNAKEGGQPLRTTIISENWDEQTVEEWTDTSKTAWRRRITRSITAQVAARTSDGVRCITVALAKDKQSDGSWGPLYGNLHQYSEPILEANVHK